MQNKVVAVLGGSGFLGRYVVERLARRGALIKVGCRRPDEAMHLKPMGNVGQIFFEPVNIRHEQSLRSFVKECDLVINLVGILYEKGKQTFQAVHHEGAQSLAKAAYEVGASSFIHISALGANLQSTSAYARSKAQGEDAVTKVFPQAVIVRPSLMFGAEDRFFQRFASWACMSPILPVLGSATSLFQPVYVGDVAESIIKIAEESRKGEVFEIGGSKSYTFRELMSLIVETIHRRRWLIPIPMPLAYGIGALGQILPNPPLTIDQIRLLKEGSVISGKYKVLADLGIPPHALEVMLPTLLSRFFRHVEMVTP